MNFFPSYPFSIELLPFSIDLCPFSMLHIIPFSLDTDPASCLIPSLNPTVFFFSLSFFVNFILQPVCDCHVQACDSYNAIQPILASIFA